MGAVGEDAVGDPAEAHAGVGVVERERVVVGAEARSAFGVADVEACRIAALEVELGAARDRPAVLSAGWPLATPPGADVGSGVATVVAAAGIMQGCADAGEAPLLIDPQVGDEVRHRKPLRTLPLRDRTRCRVTSAVAGINEAGRRQVHRAPLRVAGSSAEMVPEKPLPNWAV